MSDMSFKQAKELIERLEFTEISLKSTLNNIDTSSTKFQNALKIQEQLLLLKPQYDKKLNIMKIIIALNIGFILGLLSSKYFL